MKSHLTTITLPALLLCLLLPVHVLHADEEEAPSLLVGANTSPHNAITMLPGEKRMVTVNPDERNPYAKRSSNEEDIVDGDHNAEETKIRARLNELRVTGRSMSDNGLRVLLGDIIIETGRVLPQIIEGQSEHLQVTNVTQDMIVLGWLDPDTHKLTGKTMQVAYDLTPHISYALHGQGAVLTKDHTSTAQSTPMGVQKMSMVRQIHDNPYVKPEIPQPRADLPREALEAAQ